jgi:putative membrane protein
LSDTRLNPSKRVAFAVTVAVFAITWIDPLWPVDQALHSSLTVVGLLWLVLHNRRWPMRTGDFIAICAFIAVHCIAARWLYSNLPYDRWLSALFGWSPHSAFGWERNHTDRLIHLLYGLCLTPALQWYAQQRWRTNPHQAFAIALALILISGLVYEWLEWGIALAMSPEAAEAYNGQQGDVWDAHMDMLLAAIGAVLTWPWLYRRVLRREQPLETQHVH